MVYLIIYSALVIGFFLGLMFFPLIYSLRGSNKENEEESDRISDIITPKT
jgi:hypothetical protein